jgi:hypothetical protein
MSCHTEVPHKWKTYTQYADTEELSYLKFWSPHHKQKQYLETNFLDETMPEDKAFE